MPFALLGGRSGPLVVTLGAVVIREEFALTVPQVSLLVSIVSLSAVVSPFAGALLDRVDPRKAYLAFCFLCSASLGALAAAGNFPEFALASVLAGLSQEPTAAAIAKLSARYHPRKAGTLLGRAHASAGAGFLLLGGLGWGTERWGFTTAVLALAAVPAAVAVVSCFYIPEPRPGDGAPTGGRPPFRYAARVAPRLTLYSLLLGAVTGGTSIFLPIFAREEAGFSTAEVAALFAVMGALVTAGQVLAGRASDRAAPTRVLRSLAAWGIPGIAALLFHPLLGAAAVAAAVLFKVPLESHQGVKGAAAARLASDAMAGRYVTVVDSAYRVSMAAGTPLLGMLASGPGYGAVWAVMLVLLGGCVVALPKGGLPEERGLRPSPGKGDRPATEFGSPEH